MSVIPTAVSAPGKVLLTGGYLVLDRDYTGLVFALDARIHCHVQSLPTGEGVTLSEVIVSSPQFESAVWRYGYRLTANHGGVEVTQLRAVSFAELHPNPFIQTALSYALSFVSAHQPGPIEPASVAILADTAYYSDPSTPSPRQVSRRPKNARFRDFGIALWEAHKTGLGSSAALVTSFIAALLTHYLPSSTFDITTERGKLTLHNLAQAAHSAAQGKIGSGFDVASAVYGSCIYRRFSPNLLTELGEPGRPGFGERLKHCVDDGPWDQEVRKDDVGTPKGLRLVMCDVDCGSQTPGMVKKVLKWREENAREAKTIWDELQAKNEALTRELRRLSHDSSNDDEKRYEVLKSCVEDVRAEIRRMGEESHVPIEPPAQTRLLDACVGVRGVIGGVVPGAGGFDAVALLIEDGEEVRGRLRQLLESWTVDKKAGDEDAEQRPGKVRILEVKQEMEGVRFEDVALYEGWIGTAMT